MVLCAWPPLRPQLPFPSLLKCKEPPGRPAVCCWCPRLAWAWQAPLINIEPSPSRNDPFSVISYDSPFPQRFHQSPAGRIGRRNTAFLRKVSWTGVEAGLVVEGSLLPGYDGFAHVFSKSLTMISFLIFYADGSTGVDWISHLLCRSALNTEWQLMSSK